MMNIHGSIVPDLGSKLSHSNRKIASSSPPFSEQHFGSSLTGGCVQSQSFRGVDKGECEKSTMELSLDDVGSPNAYVVETGVAEFRGPVVYGIVRFLQVDERSSRIEATLSGLSPDSAHPWSVNEFGDLRNVPSSIGSPYSPSTKTSMAALKHEGKLEHPAGVLGAIVADSYGQAETYVQSNHLMVWDVIGRSIVIQNSLKHTPSAGQGSSLQDPLATAVIARSSYNRDSHQKCVSLCNCDGTVTWKSKHADY